MPSERSAEERPDDTDAPRGGAGRRRLTLAIDLALIALLGSVCYFPGLTAQGLTNTQESLRALAALEMHQRGDWIVPTIHGRPYLDKPPLMYWVQLDLAMIPGVTPGEMTVRLTVALFGVLGLLATYLSGRGLFADLGPRGARTASLWGVALLGSGILFTRSARIGELDILLVMPTALGVLSMHRLTRLRSEAPIAVGRWIGWLVLLMVCGAMAALTKGPPGIATLAVAVPGAILLAHLAQDLRSGGLSDRRLRAAAVAGVLAGAALVLARVGEVGDVNDALGLVVFVLLVGTLGSAFVLVATGRGLGSLAGRVLASGVIEVLVAAAGSLALWGIAVSARLGPEAIRQAADEQTAENLHLLSLGTPVRHLTTAIYGCGLGSLAALGGLILIARRRLDLSPGVWTAVSWAILAFGVYLVAGHPSERYLTPVWGGTALLGGWWIASTPGWRARGRVLGVGCALLAAGQIAWYAAGRERLYGFRSPRDLAAYVFESPELRRFVEEERVAVIDFWVPAWDVYTGVPAVPVQQHDAFADLVGPPVPIEAFAERVAVSGREWLALVRLESYGRYAPGAEVLREAGLEVVRVIEHPAEYRKDKLRTTIGLAIVRSPRAAD